MQLGNGVFNGRVLLPDERGAPGQVTQLDN